MKYEYLDHTADAKFRAFGNNIEEAFTNSALAFTGIMTQQEIKAAVSKKIKVKSNSLESLLFDFLEELIFLLDTEGFILSEITKLNIDEDKFELEAEFKGDNADNYEMYTMIKAMTYHEMKIEKQENKIIIEAVPDI